MVKTWLDSFPRKIWSVSLIESQRMVEGKSGFHVLEGRVMIACCAGQDRISCLAEKDRISCHAVKYWISFLTGKYRILCHAVKYTVCPKKSVPVITWSEISHTFQCTALTKLFMAL